jgi:hypothetical protein
MAVEFAEEAAMAEITFNTAQQNAPARKRLETTPAARAGVTATYLPMIRRLLVRGLMILSAAAALAVIMELKLAIYLLRLTHQ